MGLVCYRLIAGFLRCYFWDSKHQMWNFIQSSSCNLMALNIERWRSIFHPGNKYIIFRRKYFWNYPCSNWFHILTIKITFASRKLFLYVISDLMMTSVVGFKTRVCLLGCMLHHAWLILHIYHGCNTCQPLSSFCGQQCLKRHRWRVAHASTDRSWVTSKWNSHGFQSQN